MPKSILRPSLFLIVLAAILYACAPEVINKYEPKVISIDPAAAVRDAERIRKEANIEVAVGFDLSVWAADSLIQDPVAISVAPDGRIFYTRASRQTSSEFDIRGYRNWMTASLSFESVEDRRKFLRETFTEGSEESEKHLKDLNKDGVLDWRDLTVEKENVWFVTDENGDGVADRTQRYLADFGEEITDVANGIEFHDGEVYIAVGPDLWKTGDDNSDGIADRTESLSHGYAVHIGFSGHGMSGVTVGPQGRIWWGIGDIGSNVTDKTGKHHKNINRGVVVRCDPDGSNFEVFAHGVRNTHEFAWDKYGNLITVDNDGDHAGERERLTYLIDGSDTGWRINWQFGKYTDPKNNAYKVWMDEEMYKTRYETRGSEQADSEQAAYFLPAIAQFVNGPTGLVYNPGTALSPKYYDHFFVAEFRGSPNNSPVHAFQMTPDGAGFALKSSEEVVKGLLPTGLDFGPEGALYIGDWINGWNTKDEGRMWKLDMGAAAGAEMELRSKVKALLVADYGSMKDQQLAELLGHQDQRLRYKAQFELAERDEDGFAGFRKIAGASKNQLARIHSIWGMAMMMRRGYDGGDALESLLLDADEEIIAQTAKMIGDLRYAAAGETLVGLLGHPSTRVRFFAMEALGRTENQAALQPILAMLREDDGKDTWLRHGGMVALGRIGDALAMRNLAGDDTRNMKAIGVVALRRMESEEVKAFLNVEDEYIVTEAARAITDDYTIPGAMSPLAQILNERPWAGEPLIRRLISANLNVGNNRAVDNLITYATNDANPEAMRAEALATLAHWASPSLFDRVDGRYRGQRSKNDAYVKEEMGKTLPALLAHTDGMVRQAAIEVAAGLRVEGVTDQLIGLLSKSKTPQNRAAALIALDRLEAPDLENLLRTAMGDKDNSVRSQALSLLPKSKIDPEKAVGLYREIIDGGGAREGQAAIRGLGQLKAASAAAYLEDLIARMRGGKLPAALHLDLIEAVESKTGDDVLRQQLKNYEDELLGTDDLGLFASALAGGSYAAGQDVFYRNSTAQCTRCHAIFEYGGNVGPNLSGVGERLAPREILTSIIRPSAALALGHETVLVTLNDADETAMSGVVLERTPEYLKLKVGKTDTKTIPYADIAEEETLPSSMPSAEGKLSRREIRDLVTFLAKEKGEEG